MIATCLKGIGSKYITYNNMVITNEEHKCLKIKDVYKG